MAWRPADLFERRLRLITIPPEQNDARVSDDASNLSVAPVDPLLCEARLNDLDHASLRRVVREI